MQNISYVKGAFNFSLKDPFVQVSFLLLPPLPPCILLLRGLRSLGLQQTQSLSLIQDQLFFIEPDEYHLVLQSQ